MDGDLAAPGFLANGGEMGGRIRGFAWEATALGSPAGWPPALQTAANILLGSNQAMMIVWGPERILMYNDGYAPLLALRHPGALGRSFFDVWPELRAKIGPMMDLAFAGEPAESEDMCLVVRRRGRPEEAHFAFSFTPVRESNGSIGGVFCPCREITEQAIRRRDLLESEKRLRIATEAAELGVFEWEAVGDRTVWHNARMRQIFARGEEEGPITKGEFLASVLHPDDAAVVKRAMAEAVEKGGVLELTVRVRTPAGGERWLKLNGACEFDEHGRPSRVVGVAQDLTKAKAAEAALRDSERRFRTMADSAPVLVWVAGTDKNISFVNKPWLDYTGRTPQQEIGYGWLELVHPDDLEACVNTYVDAFERRREFRMDFRLKRRDGEYRWLLDHGVPRLEPDGRFLGYIGSCVDITERKDAEEGLRASEARFRTLADNIAQLVWMADEHGSIFWYNKRWIDYTGRPLDRMITGGWQGVVHPDHAERVVDRFRRDIAAGRVWDDTFPLRGRDRRYRWFLSRAVPIRDDSGRVTRWFGTNTDVTESKLHEEHMQTVMAELNHRVKNTLAVVDSIARQTARNASDMEAFQSSFGARLRSMAAAHALLTQSNWEGARLRDIVEGELRMRAGSAEQYRTTGPRLLLRPKAALALHMAVHELAVNAGEHGALTTPVGRVAVTWAIQTGGQEGEPRRGDGDEQGAPATWLRLEWVEHAIAPVRAPATPGYGLRLIEQLVSYELAGTIQFDFAPDGLRCVIEFPLSSGEGGGGSPRKGDTGLRGQGEGGASGELRSSAVLAASDCGGSGSSPDHDGHSRPRVLVAEDNLALATWVCENLEEAGLRVVGPAPRLAEALELAGSGQFDAAVLDVDLDGEKVYPLALDLRRRGVPFVLLTGYNRRDIPDELRDAPMLSKPLDPGALRTVLSGFVPLPGG